MRNARIFEIGVIFFGACILIFSAAVALQVSMLSGAALFVVLSLGLIWLIYNHDAWIVRRLNTKDDPLIFNLCQSGFVGRVRSITRFIPASPRCRFCLVPFGGIGRLLGIKPAAKNPNFCRSCFAALPNETVDMEVGILFGDLRGFTAWSEKRPPQEVADAVTRFYAIATRELTRDDALVDYIGDQVMAIYPFAMPSLRTRAEDKMLAAAKRLVAGVVKDDLPLDVGIGMNVGVANIGTFQTGAAKDFTAVGDTVNLAARFQAEAGPRELVYAAGMTDRFSMPPKDARSTKFTLKGKSSPVEACVLSL